MPSQSESQLIESIQSHFVHLAEAVAAAEFWQKQCLANAEQEYQQRVTDVNKQYQQEIANADAAYAPAPQEHERSLAESRNRYEQVSKDILATYENEEARITSERQQLLETVNFLTKTWDDPVWNDWQPHTTQTLPEVVRFGQLRVPGHWETPSFPAFLPLFVGGQSILFEASGAAKVRAVNAIQSCLLRLLACVPPGKLKFTLLDPVALGHNAAPFMHLADYDEALVTARAWSEKTHIERQLVDLTEHISNVIQKYLRNQYAIIEAYNEQAGEVAEPYRVLVVFDFPVNFSDDAARRLVSIVQNGARCGVYTIILHDTAQPLPYGFNVKDLEQSTTIITWNGDAFVWKDQDFQACDLELDQPPAEIFFNTIVNTVGKASVEASRVEVPFEKVLEKAELIESSWWQGSTANGIQVPLGPIGAKKVQHLELGVGTLHNALIVGQVGSGKSTLFHVLITTLALKYSSDEIELYLIDFKKGVEFKTYATHQLPHARVIAIESEREFGLSVLEGLDAEFKRRGDLLRNAGVNNLSKYRRQTQQRLPRILLIVDEFHEFFMPDDAVASKVSQILERLVREGRAFGIHVLLGSQTLGGQYRLSPSTSGQMAIRIALQCMESDSRLILSDDNPAARLLSRPGEAIYNSANGLIEGNNPFQVAWLPDDKQDAYLDKVQALAENQGLFPPKAQIVFEGNAPAHPEHNQALNALLRNPLWSEPLRRCSAWLGEPIAIKEATAAHFRRQSGNNLLVVGQHDEAVAGMLTINLLTLTAQHQPAMVRFYILDFGNVDAPHARFLKHATEMLPCSITYGSRKQLASIIQTLAQEIDQRSEHEDLDREQKPSIYLVIYGLQRVRDFDKDDSLSSGFSFGNPDEPAKPENLGKLFPKILREGSDMGIHTIVWCDTYTNFQRRLGYQTLREFDMRVVFQMSDDDSAQLIDAKDASKLGPHRALFYSEEEGRLEKFRPFALPEKSWLKQIGTTFKEILKR